MRKPGCLKAAKDWRGAAGADDAVLKQIPVEWEAAGNVVERAISAEPPAVNQPFSMRVLVPFLPL